MNEQEFKARTKKFALRVIACVNALPRSDVSRVIGAQLLRSGTSVGANYRAACRGRSAADMLSKLAIVEEEADESSFWMELLVESKTIPESRLSALLDECNQILAMTVASIRTIRARRR